MSYEFISRLIDLTAKRVDSKLVLCLSFVVILGGVISTRYVVSALEGELLVRFRFCYSVVFFALSPES